MRMPIRLGLLALVGCGGAGSSPAESPITPTSSGLSSASTTIPSGGQVHFFNKDTVDHQIASTTCPALASKRLAPGTDDLRPPLTGPLSCSFSDALTSSATFSGTVTVSAPGGGGRGY
ncbi:MAG: hypothetical protein NVSMB23_25520 [Myxococcales bacterium]